MPIQSEQDPTRVADTLYHLCVEAPIDVLDPQRFCIPTEYWKAYSAKARTYREAAVLSVLLSKVKSDPGYLLQAFEGCIFPRKPTPEAMAKVTALGRAINEIATLVDPRNKGRELRWGDRWLSDVGIRDFNLAYVAAFSLAWMDHYIDLHNIVCKLRP